MKRARTNDSSQATKNSDMQRFFTPLNKAIHEKRFEDAEKLAKESKVIKGNLPFFIQPDLMYHDNQVEIEGITIRVNDSRYIYSEKVDMKDLFINGAVTFTESVKAKNCSIFKSLVPSDLTIASSFDTNSKISLGEIIFEKGFHCNRVEVTDTLSSLCIGIAGELHYHV